MIVRLFLAGIPMIVTYIIGVSLTGINAYELWYPTSPIMHTLGGFVTAWTIWTIIRLCIAKKHIVRAHTLFIQLAVIGGVLMVGVAWEWYEYILDVAFDTNHILGVGDTLIDLTMDTFGAIIYSIAILRVDKKEQF